MTSRYAHVSAFKAEVGPRVRRGQLIAQVGNTGRSTGPHLHYEVHIAGVPTNPRNYLTD
jgi:murein DD-endopeptidase MepM/ murein hydrolase activator NlpD